MWKRLSLIRTCGEALLGALYAAFPTFVFSMSLLGSLVLLTVIPGPCKPTVVYNHWTGTNGRREQWNRKFSKMRS